MTQLVIWQIHNLANRQINILNGEKNQAAVSFPTLGPKLRQFRPETRILCPFGWQPHFLQGMKAAITSGFRTCLEFHPLLAFSKLLMGRMGDDNALFLGKFTIYEFANFHYLEKEDS